MKITKKTLDKLCEHFPVERKRCETLLIKNGMIEKKKDEYFLTKTGKKLTKLVKGAKK